MLDSLIVRLRLREDYKVKFVGTETNQMPYPVVLQPIKTWLDENTPGWKLSGNVGRLFIRFTSDDHAVAFMLRWR